MVMSSISQHPRNATLASAIGQELRRRRVAEGLSQAALGRPYTRAFVSAVELGRAVPSIPALTVLLDNLGLGLDEFFWGVQQHMTVRYTVRHGDREEASARRRR
jgi:transcriptional regulator with XRE-family HTH domain